MREIRTSGSVGGADATAPTPAATNAGGSRGPASAPTRQLKTGRVVKVQSDNDKVLTSFAHLMGAPIAGSGDDPQCGPLPL